MSVANSFQKYGQDRERKTEAAGVARETRRGVPLILCKLIIVQLQKYKRLTAQTDVRKQ